MTVSTPTELPLAEPLPENLTAVEVFSRLAHRPHCIFFDSASCERNYGRYSFVAADPFQWLMVSADGTDALALLEASWKEYLTSSRDDLPPFQGGAA